MGEFQQGSPTVASGAVDCRPRLTVTAHMHDVDMIKHVFEQRGRRAHQVSTSQVRHRHRLEVARWAMSNGVALQRDALSVIIATRDMNTDGSICTTWVPDTITELFAWRADAWCANHRVIRPTGLGESLEGYLRYLDSTRLLSERSQILAVLLDELSQTMMEMDHGDSAGWSGSDGSLIQLIPKKSSMVARPS